MTYLPVMKRSFFTLLTKVPVWKVSLISLVCGAAIVLKSLPSLAQLNRSQALQLTVRINRPNSENGGSGVLVKHEGNRYTVLTNCHVLKGQSSLGGNGPLEPIRGTYVLEINGNQHSVTITEPQCHPRGIDLAIIEFESNQNYQVAPLRSETNLEVLLNEQQITVAGFNNVYTEERTNAVQPRRFQFGEGSWRDRRENIRDGYDLLHNYETLVGMSGGPIFDADGNLVAINGETVPVSEFVTAFSAIPVHYYTSWQSTRQASTLAVETTEQLPSISPEQQQAEEFFARAVENTPPVIQLPDPSNNVLDITYECMRSPQGVPTTYARMNNGTDNVPVIRWQADFFSNSGWTPVQRCLAVSQRMEVFRRANQLRFLVSSYVQSNTGTWYPVICVSNSDNLKCDGILLTLEIGEDPESFLEQFLNNALTSSSYNTVSRGCRDLDKCLS